MGEGTASPAEAAAAVAAEAAPAAATDGSGGAAWWRHARGPLPNAFDRSRAAPIAAEPVTLMAELRAGCVASAVTLVFTTSAVPTNPETMFFESVLKSYTSFEPCLLGAVKLIVCDHEQVQEANDYRIGKVTAECASKYHEYKARLASLCAGGANDPASPFHRARVVELPKRHGYGRAVRFALSLVSTPYVIVVQHDRELRASFGLCALLRGLQTFALRHVNYVALGTRATWNTGHRALCDFNVDVRDYAIEVEGLDPRLIVPLPFWYDTTHLCRTTFYRDFAMREQAVDIQGKIPIWKWRTGEFIEDKIGQLLRLQFREHGLKAHTRFGTYLLVHKADKALCFTPSPSLSRHSKDWYARFEHADWQPPAAEHEQDEQHSRGADSDEDEDKAAQRGRLPAIGVFGNPNNVTDADVRRHVLITHLNQRKLRTVFKVHREAIMQRGEDTHGVFSHELVAAVLQHDKVDKSSASC
jgi:hypothetical protein